MAIFSAASKRLRHRQHSSCRHNGVGDKVSITNDATGAMSFYSDAQFNFFESDNMTNAVGTF